MNKLFVIVFISISNFLFADIVKDSVEHKKGIKIGVAPILGYNSDFGFIYGLSANLFDYGENRYPDYKYSVYQEAYLSTFGSIKLKSKFDSRNLIPKFRLLALATFQKDQRINFLGFNSLIHDEFCDHSGDDFYKIGRELKRFRTSSFYNIFNDLHIYFGLGINSIRVNSIAENSLYEKLRNEKFIKEVSKNGGLNVISELGIVFDSRDHIKYPTKGIWVEAIATRSVYSSNTKNFSKVYFNNRMYQPVSKKIVWANRVGAQLSLDDNVPFYMLPYIYTTNEIYDGLGGFKTIRGVELNKIVCNSLGYLNTEIRYKFFEKCVLGKNIFIVITPFVDAGFVLDEFMDEHSYNMYENQNLVISGGAGMRLGINHNFILSLDYGKSIYSNSNSSGLYSGLNFLF